MAAQCTTKCGLCSQSFPSRTQLFKHLGIAHPGAGAPPASSLVKVALLIGYEGATSDSSKPEKDELCEVGGRAVQWDSAIGSTYGSFEYGLWTALQQLEKEQQISIDSTATEPTAPPRPPGWSRATESNSPFLSQPAGGRCVSELVCLSLPALLSNNDDSAAAAATTWVNRLNTHLKPHGMVCHGRCSVPPSCQASRHCDVQRYDVLVPIEVLFPDLVASEGLPPHLALNDNCDDDTSNNSSNSSSGSALVGTSFKAPPLPRPNAAEPGDAWSNEWVEGFRDLKHLLQRFQGRHNWHNFCPGVLPHDTVATSPKLIRFRHRFTRRLAHNNVAVQEGSGTTAPSTASGATCQPAAASSALPTPPSTGCFVVLSLHGSAFLRSHAEALVGFAIAMHRKWLPAHVLEDSWRPSVVLPPGLGLDAVALPAHCCSFFVEGRYDAFEAKQHVLLRPRGPEDGDPAAGVQTAKKDLLSSDRGNGEQRKKVAKKSRGHDNWLCSACNASNFAKRSECFQCDAPRASTTNAAADDKDENATATIATATVASTAVATESATDTTANAVANTVGVNTGAGAVASASANTTATEPASAAVANKVHFRGFSGSVGETARASADKWRDQLLVSIAVAEAKRGHVRAWAETTEARSKELREAWVAAAALAAPAGNDGTKNSRMHRNATAAANGAAVLTASAAAAAAADSGTLTSSKAAAIAPLPPSLPVPPPLPPPPSAAVMEVYGRVLALLREADASGEWPATSATRAKVLAATFPSPLASSAKAASTPATTVADAIIYASDDANSANVADASANASSAAPPASLASPGTKPAKAVEEVASFRAAPVPQGGTFAVGSMPPPLAPPKANERFFDLMEAAFELEKALAPHRPPSSTIAVNRHAQFTPHTDSGSGAGQSTSLIVALGDFTGGELCVEGQVHDLRYKMLEFNGWTERHWTLPFTGERYSLVWFTPNGCSTPGLELCREMRLQREENNLGS